MSIFNSPNLVVLHSYPRLPARAPIGFPHLVDLTSLSDDYPPSTMTIADLVVSILYNYRPEALTAFLDLERQYVHFVRRSPTAQDFCIARSGKIVKVI